jgi:hypothetical protein
MYSYVFDFFFLIKIFFFCSIEKKICDNISINSGGVLPCTGEFEVGIDSGNECICQCQTGFTNTSTGCTNSELYIIKIE